MKTEKTTTQAESNLNVISSCPFCGGEAELILRGNAFTKKRNAEIRCGSCNVEMVVGAIYNSLEWCQEKVIQKWNRRAGHDHHPTH